MNLVEAVIRAAHPEGCPACREGCEQCALIAGLDAARADADALAEAGGRLRHIDDGDDLDRAHWAWDTAFLAHEAQEDTP